jgi:hypothetical protein
MPSQHAGLSPERWAGFSLDQQVLMIANEMNRACRHVDKGDLDRLLPTYQRVLNLVDLTTAVQSRPTLRRELLRWRDLVAELFVRGRADSTAHRAALRCLLRFTPVASAQIPLLAACRADA